MATLQQRSSHCSKTTRHGRQSHYSTLFCSSSWSSLHCSKKGEHLVPYGCTIPRKGIPPTIVTAPGSVLVFVHGRGDASPRTRHQLEKPRGKTPHTDSKASFHQHGRERGGLGPSLLADSSPAGGRRKRERESERASKHRVVCLSPNAKLRRH